MSNLALTFAGESYFDRTLALETGQVSPEGIDLNYLVLPVGDLFRRMAQDAEFEAGEMSVSTFMLMLGRGDDRFVGVPVFPSRNFRHNGIYVHAGADIKKPQDLVGRNVGVVEYQMTAALWIRAFLQHTYGVAPADIHWWTGGLTSPEYHERLAHNVPSDVRLDRIPSDQSLEGMLESGELDALVTPTPPLPFRAGSRNIRRLFEDYPSVEREYYRQTGIFPIMHTVVVRRDVYEANPWVPRALMDAFAESKRVGMERMREVGTLAVSLPWLAPALAEVDELFQGDAFSYGMERNRPVLEALVQYSYEQGLSERKLEVPDLFAAETWDWSE